MNASIPTPHGPVSARIDVPPEGRALFVFAHGAGAGMDHAFMQALSSRLNLRGIATVRYQFPYWERGSRRPDPRAVLVDTVVAATANARTVSDLPLVVGGKSMGGRMSSHAAAEGRLGDVRGLLFVGFPLHPAKKPGATRAAHLPEVTVPMLFLQGTRDALADLDLVRETTAPLDTATLHVVEGADHGFHVLKRSGRTDDEVLDELAETTAGWVDRLLR